MKYKYPRTFHLPFSPGVTDDDKVIPDLSAFEGQRVVITEKMDGENTTIYPNGDTHARSIDSKYHESRSWVKKAAYDLRYRIESGSHPNADKDLRFCGENMFAKHSIHYTNLESYFYLFNIWEKGFCLDWETTIIVAERYNLQVVPVIYEGLFDELLVRALPQTLRENQEGFVMRKAGQISASDWYKDVAKWVRPNHVQTDQHWMHSKIIKNELK